MWQRGSRQAGFGFLEMILLFVAAKILVSSVITLIPRMVERSRQNESTYNVRNLLDMMIMRRVRKGWPPYSGKNFVLSLVATGEIDPRVPDHMEVFFSPGDRLYTLDRADVSRYLEITPATLKFGDFHELTSYAGRRNGEKDFVITPDAEARGVPVMCDDDDGPLHHPSGLVVGYTSRRVSLMEWEDLEIAPPADRYNPEPFLGDDAATDTLRALSSQ